MKKVVNEVVQQSTQEIVRLQIASMSLEERRKIFPPMVKKNFVVRKNWYGRGQIITFTTNKGKEVTYSHDKVYDLMIDGLETKNAWKKYGYWSQSTDLPMLIRFRPDLLPDEDQKFLEELKKGK